MKKCKCGNKISKTKYKRCRKCSDKIHSIFMKGNNYFKGHKHTEKSKELIKKHHADVSGGKNPNYINGEGNTPYPIEFTEQLKESIRKRDNYICQNCGMVEEEHLIVYGRTLDVHHIDYNKQNCKKDNLITLCDGCNIRANYNRDYWIDYFKKIYKTIKEK